MDIGAGISLFVMLINLVLILAIICAGVGVLQSYIDATYYLVLLLPRKERKRTNHFNPDYFNFPKETIGCNVISNALPHVNSGFNSSS